MSIQYSESKVTKTKQPFNIRVKNHKMFTRKDLRKMLICNYSYEKVRQFLFPLKRGVCPELPLPYSLMKAASFS